MMGVSIGWIVINLVYFDFFPDDEDDDELYTIIELEEGEPLSVPSEWEY